MSRVLKILLLFLVLSLFPIKLVKADDKFCLEKEGFFASVSIFSPIGIKTNAPHEIRIRAIENAQSL